MTFCVAVFAFLWGVYLGMEFLHHVMIEELPGCFQSGCIVLYSHQQCVRC